MAGNDSGQPPPDPATTADAPGEIDEDRRAELERERQQNRSALIGLAVVVVLVALTVVGLWTAATQLPDIVQQPGVEQVAPAPAGGAAPGSRP